MGKPTKKSRLKDARENRERRLKGSLLPSEKDGSEITRKMSIHRRRLNLKKSIKEKDDPRCDLSLTWDEIDNIPDITDME